MPVNEAFLACRSLFADVNVKSHDYYFPENCSSFCLEGNQADHAHFFCNSSESPAIFLLCRQQRFSSSARESLISLLRTTIYNNAS